MLNSPVCPGGRQAGISIDWCIMLMLMLISLFLFVKVKTGLQCVEEKRRREAKTCQKTFLQLSNNAFRRLSQGRITPGMSSSFRFSCSVMFCPGFLSGLLSSHNFLSIFTSPLHFVFLSALTFRPITYLLYPPPEIISARSGTLEPCYHLKKVNGNNCLIIGR